MSSANANRKTYLFGNPNTLKLKHMYNGGGAIPAEGQALVQVYDITGCDITKGGDVHMSRADNDFYPRNGGMSDASFALRLTTKNMSALNTFTKGDELEDISIMYEGRAEARTKILTLGLSGGIVSEDVAISGQHGAEPGTGTLGIEATIPVNSDGTSTGVNGPYHIPWEMRIGNDVTRDDTWTPPAITIP
jgi:hypothetical protein